MTDVKTKQNKKKLPKTRNKITGVNKMVWWYTQWHDARLSIWQNITNICCISKKEKYKKKTQCLERIRNVTTMDIDIYKKSDHVLGI